MTSENINEQNLVLRHTKYKQYWVYFFAVMFSLTGINLFVYTQGWYILDISGSKLSVGLSWSIFFTPGLFLLPILGKLLDSPYSKIILCVFEFIRAFILLLFIPLLYYIPKVYMVYLMAGFFGLFFSTFYPSIYVVLKKLVDEEEISKYSHMFELSIQIASSVSILISGFLYQKLGFFILVGIGGVLIILAGCMISSLNLKVNADSGKFSLVSEYKNFFNLFKSIFHSNSNERKNYLFGFFHQFPQNMIMATNIPILLYVYETMAKGPMEYGILDALIGIAAMVAGIFWTKYYQYSQKKLFVVMMPLLTGIAFIAIGIITPWIILPYLMFYIMGTFLTSSKIQCRAAILKTTPKEVIGRLTSLYQTISYIVTLVLAFLLSYLCQNIHVQSVFLLLGVFMFIFVLFLSWAYVPRD